jgi:hypothetical protein
VQLLGQTVNSYRHERRVSDLLRAVATVDGIHRHVALPARPPPIIAAMAETDKVQASTCLQARIGAGKNERG